MIQSKISNHILRACAVVALSAICLPLGALAADQHSVNDDLNNRMRDAAKTASKQKSLDQMLAPHMPNVPLHTEYVVETNNKGQVARVRSGKNSSDRTFDLMTYGNVLQTFIRKQDGKADAGTFRITYDYSPQTHGVKRNVSVVSLGGVNPNAEGAVYAMKREEAAGAKPKK